jgi:hypothetical protein
MAATVDPYDARTSQPVYVLGSAALLILGLGGFVLWWGRHPDHLARRRDALLLFGYAGVAAFVVPTIFFTLARFTLPWQTVLTVGVGLLLAQLSERPGSSEPELGPDDHNSSSCLPHPVTRSSELVE